MNRFYVVKIIRDEFDKYLVSAASEIEALEKAKSFDRIKIGKNFPMSYPVVEQVLDFMYISNAKQRVLTASLEELIEIQGELQDIAAVIVPSNAFVNKTLGEINIIINEFTVPKFLSYSYRLRTLMADLFETYNFLLNRIRYTGSPVDRYPHLRDVTEERLKNASHEELAYYIDWIASLTGFPNRGYNSPFDDLINYLIRYDYYHFSDNHAVIVDDILWIKSANGNDI